MVQYHLTDHTVKATYLSSGAFSMLLHMPPLDAADFESAD